MQGEGNAGKVAVMEKKPSNASVLSVYIGSRLMPGRDGKPQRKLSMEEAERIAKKRRSK